jgi:hypothetical protein
VSPAPLTSNPYHTAKLLLDCFLCIAHRPDIWREETMGMKRRPVYCLSDDTT